MAGRGTESRGGNVATRGIAGVSLLFVFLTAAFTYPFSLAPGTSLVVDNPDAHLYMWTLAWDAHAFVTQPLAIFDANIFHPHGHTLAYSENLIGSALVAAPVLWLTGNPVLATNLVMLLSVVLCGVGAFVLARRLGVGVAASLLCGIVFAFSPARFFRLSQLHLTAVQWIPFMLASLHAYLDSGRRGALLAAAAFFTLQALTSGHGAVFAVLAGAIVLAWHVTRGGPLAPRRTVRDLGFAGLVVLLPAALVAVPYRQVQIEMGLARTLDNWVVTPASFLASPSHVHTWILARLGLVHVNDAAAAFLFPGWLPLVLAGAALIPRRTSRPPGRIWQGRRALELLAWLSTVAAVAAAAVAIAVSLDGPVRWRAGGELVLSIRNPRRAWMAAAIGLAVRAALLRQVPLAQLSALRRFPDAWRARADTHCRDATMPYALMTLACVWLSAGPPLGIWPLVHWMPGLNFMRVPSRFMILAVLGLAVLTGAGFDRLAARLDIRRRTVAATVVAGLLAAEFLVAPLPTTPYRLELPAVDRWLASQPGPLVVAEVPLGYGARWQTTYMLHAMAHWQKTVHGYSGIESPPHEALYRAMRRFPDDTSRAALVRFGVTHLVVHPGLYDEADWTDVERRLLDASSWLTLVHRDSSGLVYAVQDPARHARVPEGDDDRADRALEVGTH